MKLAPLLWAGLGIIILAIVGFLPSILVIVALIGILITCYGLTQAFPAKAKLIGQLIALIVVFGLLINGYVYFIKPRSPMTQEALSRAQVAGDLIGSLMVSPNMLEARLGSADQLRWAQKTLGKEFYDKYENIRKKHLDGKINAIQATEETLAILEQVKKYNEKMATATTAQADLKTHFRLMLIAVPLLVIALIPQILLPGKRFLGGAGTILLVIGFVLWAFPEIKNVFSRFEFPHAQFEPPSTPPEKPKKTSATTTKKAPAAPVVKAVRLNTIIPTDRKLGYGEILRVELRDVSPSPPAYVKWILRDQFGTPFKPIIWSPEQIARGWNTLEGGDRWKDQIFDISIEFPPGTIVRDIETKKIEVVLTPPLSPRISKETIALQIPPKNEPPIKLNYNEGVSVVFEGPPRWVRWNITDANGISYKPRFWPAGAKGRTYTNNVPGKTFFIRIEIPQSDKNFEVKVRKYQTESVPLG